MLTTPVRPAADSDVTVMEGRRRVTSITFASYDGSNADLKEPLTHFVDRFRDFVRNIVDSDRDNR